jgi:hypothetical protein
MKQLYAESIIEHVGGREMVALTGVVALRTLISDEL